MMTRTITIICREGNDFDVQEGERIAPKLCWDEMLGTIAELTHPSINRARYRMYEPDALASLKPWSYKGTE